MFKLPSLSRRLMLIAGIAALTASAVHAGALDTIKQTKKLRVGIDLAIPPYGMVDDKLQPAGVDVDVARLLAADLGATMEIVSTTGPTRIPNLQTNKADLIISTLSITPERQKVIDFSVPYAGLQTIVFAPKATKIAGVGDLAGKSVAVTRSTTQDTHLTREAKGAQIVRYEDDATLVTAGVTGQADIIGAAPMQLHAVNQKNPDRQMEAKFVLSNFGLGIGMRKDEPELLAWVNAWVKTNLNNGKLNAIYKKHFGRDLPDEIVAGGK